MHAVKKVKKYSREIIEKAVKEAKSARRACQLLEISTGGSNSTRLRKFLEKNGYDISHWTGQSWSKDLTVLTDNRVWTKYSKEEVFSENSKASTCLLRKLIKKYNLLENKCAHCGLVDTWNGKPLNLQLDHISGNRHDQRIENLRWLCPNCHSQTDTFTSKNSKHKRVSDKELMDALKESDTIWEALKKVNLANGRHYKRAYKLLDKIRTMPNGEEGKKSTGGLEINKKEQTPRVSKTKGTDNNCKICGKETNNKIYCSYKCSHVAQNKIDWSKYNLKDLADKMSLVQMGKLLDVSDNSVKKQIKCQGIPIPDGRRTGIPCVKQENAPPSTTK